MKLLSVAVVLLLCLAAQKPPKGIVRTYDTFRDETTVRMEQARAKGGDFWASYDYKGKVQPAVTELYLTFFFGSREWLLLNSDHEVRLKLNGSEIISLGKGAYVNKVGTNRNQYLTQEIVVVRIAMADAVKASNADTLSAQVGSLIVELPPKVVGMFKTLVAFAQGQP